MPNKLNIFLSNLRKKEKRAVSIDDVLWRLYIDIMDDRPMAYVNGFYMEDSKLFAVISDGGKLYRAAIKFKGQDAYVSEDWYEVVLEFNPSESRDKKKLIELARSISTRGKNSTTIQRTEDDKWRWISISCSAVLNRSGSIDSRELMDSFIRHIEEGEAYPHREFYHMGEQYRTGQTDYVARDGYLLITSGIYDDNKLAELEIEARLTDPDYWGDSIEFLPVSEPEMLEVMDGVEIVIYNDGILRSISTLPEKEAAALFTSETTLEEVNRMSLTDKAWTALVKLFKGDEDEAKKWLEDNTDPTNRQITEEELVAREKAVQEREEALEKGDDDLDPEANLDPEADPVVDPDADDTDNADDDDSDADDNDKEFEIDEDLIPVLQEAILTDKRFEALLQIPDMLVPLVEQVTEISEKVSAFEDRVAEMERSDEEKQDAWSKDLGKKARQVVTVNYRAKKDAEDDDEEETTDTAAHVKEILKDVPKYGPDTKLTNMPE